VILMAIKQNMVIFHGIFSMGKTASDHLLESELGAMALTFCELERSTIFNG